MSGQAAAVAERLTVGCHDDAMPRPEPLRIDGHELTVEIRRSLEGLQGLRSSWSDLLSDSSAESAFATWEWLANWAQCFVGPNRRPLVILVHDGPQLIGLAPWYVQRRSAGPLHVREIRFLGLPEAGSDYLDVITRRRKESLVARALLATLYGQLASEWDVVRLQDVPADSVFLARLLAQLRLAGKHCEIAEGSCCPGAYLPGSFESYLGQLSGHARRAYRRKMRLLMSHGEVAHTVSRGAELGAALEVLQALYARRWGTSADDLFRLLVRCGERNDAGWHVEVDLLRVGSRPVAGLLHLVNGRKKCQYLMAIDRAFDKSISLGTLMSGLSIQSAIEEGFTDYDFLKGQEEFKLQLMNRLRVSFDLTIFNRTMASVATWSVGRARALGKIILR